MGGFLVKIKINLARKGMDRIGSLKTTRAMQRLDWSGNPEVGGMDPVPFKREKCYLCRPLSKP